MHTLQFDPAIERQLDRIANQTGKKVDQLIEQAVLDFLSERTANNGSGGLVHERKAANDMQAQALYNDLRKWVESQPMQTESAGTFTRRMRDEERY
ncbi:MAG: hypothetical protein ACU837_07790 [Gammaproteobacteria bacterium]